MKTNLDTLKGFIGIKFLRRTVKTIGFFVLGLVTLILISAAGLRIYIGNYKDEIVKKINIQINENLSGKVKIGDIGYRFLAGFPNFTLVLSRVELQDSLIVIHNRPVLKADEIEVRMNVMSLLKKEVVIHKIVINDARIDLFRDKNGSTNSNIFRSQKKKTKSSAKVSIGEVVLNNVNFISENQQGKKLFNFEIKSLKSKIQYSKQGWATDVDLKTFAKSLAFNTDKGSFVKDKEIDGNLSISFSNEQNRISIVANELEIGEDFFNIKAHFNVGKGNSLFDIDIRTQIKWRNASNLLSKNISSKLNKFDLQQPLFASCVIKGDMNVKGDPEIVVNAKIKDDQLETSYGLVNNCSFDGKFTNNHTNGLGFTDANSAIIITDFKGIYKEIPLNIPSAIINNLEKPVATGKFHSEYDVSKLRNFINEDFIKFTVGTAKVNLDFKVDIVDVKLHKPKFTGAIVIKNATLFLKSKNVNFKKTDVDLYFTDQALLMKKIKFKDKVNTVFMEGRVDNFLNLYYDAPEKMNVKWKIYSPYLDVRQIVDVLSFNYGLPSKSKRNSQSSNQLQEVLRKSQVSLDIKVDKLTYQKMMANNFRVNIVMAKKGLYVNDVSIRGSTGSMLNFEANVIPGGKSLFFTTKIKVRDGNISRFLASFNNFGVKSFSPNDISGELSFNATINGLINEKRDLVTNSIAGDVSFLIQNGALSNFAPLVKIGKAAFPRRDVKNITFSDLSGNASINGSLINLKELKVSSNILNIDAKGTYSLTNIGTNLAVKIPLRNPKDDSKIADKNQRDAVRYKGVVVNLLVLDGKDGQIKIKLGKPQEEQPENEKATDEKTKRVKRKRI